VGSRPDCTWVLGLPEFRMENVEGADDSGTTRLRVHLERHGRRYPCSGCGRRISPVRSMKERLRQQIGVDCQSMSTSHAEVRMQ
jgi:RNase P subunit RPR2